MNLLESSELDFGPLQVLAPGESREKLLRRFEGGLGGGEAQNVLERLQLSNLWAQRYLSPHALDRPLAEIVGCDPGILRQHIVCSPTLAQGPGRLRNALYKFRSRRFPAIFDYLGPDQALLYHLWIRRKLVRSLQGGIDCATATATATGSDLPLRVIIDASRAVLDGWLAHPSPDTISFLRRVVHVERQHLPGLIHSVLIVNTPPSIIMAWAGWRHLLALPKSSHFRMYEPGDLSWTKGIALPTSVGGVEEWLASDNCITEETNWMRNVVTYAMYLWEAFIAMGLIIRSLLGIVEHESVLANTVPLLHPPDINRLNPALSAARRKPSITVNGIDMAATNRRRRSSWFSSSVDAAVGQSLLSEAEKEFLCNALACAEVSVHLAPVFEGRSQDAAGARGPNGTVDSLDKMRVAVRAADASQWTVDRRIFEFVALRTKLVSEGVLLRSEPWDRGGKIWDLPPSLHAQALARGLDTFLKVLMTDSRATQSRDVMQFLELIQNAGAVARDKNIPSSTWELATWADDESSMASSGHFFGDEDEEEHERNNSIGRAVARVGQKGSIGDIGATWHSAFQVRSKTYLKDGRKQESLSSFLRLEKAMLVSLTHPETRVDHIVARGAAAQALRDITSGPNPPFVFVFNFQVPPASSSFMSSSNDTRDEAGAAAAPSKDCSMSLVLFFVLDSKWDDLSDAGRQLIVRYCDTAAYGRPTGLNFQEERLKVIPIVENGPWVVRKALNSGKPSLIGRHTTMRLYPGPCYLETDIDVGSSTLARGAVTALSASLPGTTVNLGILIEAREEPFLPERLLGAFQLSRCVPSEALPLERYEDLGFGAADPIQLFASHPLYKREGMIHLRPAMRRMFADPVPSSSLVIGKEGNLNVFGRLVHCEFFWWDIDAPGERFDHAAQRVKPLVEALRRTTRASWGRNSGNFFILNIQLPQAVQGRGVSLVCFWDLPTPSSAELELERRGSDAGTAGALRRIQRFMRAPRRGGVSDEVRRIVSELKFNFHIREGPRGLKRLGGDDGVWIRPSNHLPMTAHWGSEYMEVGMVVDRVALGSLPPNVPHLAAVCASLCNPVALSLDLRILLLHEDEDVDQEKILLGGVRLHHVDIAKCQPLAETDIGYGGGHGSSGGTPPPGPSAIFFADAAHQGTWSLRGKSYLSDRKKCDAGPPLGKMLRGELFRSRDLPDAKGEHIASYGRGKAAVQGLLDSMAASGAPSPFLFIYNLQVPAGQDPFNIVCYLGIPSLDPSHWRNEDEATAIKLLGRFVDLPEEQNSDDPGALAPDDFRNERFKLIPRIRSAPWAVQAAVGSKPVLLGKRLTQRYFRGPGYFELCIDVGSNPVAKNVVGMCTAASKLLVCDLALTVEGRHESELPEKCIGVFTIDSVDTAYLDEL